MPTTQGGRRRTGGRSARVRGAVHAAVEELIAAHGAGNVTIPDVAARSGVNPSTLYRRWGTLDGLLVDLAVSRLEQAAPVPDTGTLRTDLLGYAHQAAHDVQWPDGLTFLRAVIATTNNSGANHGVDPATDQDAAPGQSDDPRIRFLAARGDQIQTMLDRAQRRGEPSLHYTEVIDIILAPLYLRVLFGVGGINDQYLSGLVDRLLD